MGTEEAPYALVPAEVPHNSDAIPAAMCCILPAEVQAAREGLLQGGESGVWGGGGSVSCAALSAAISERAR